jgi:hypothetical protein
MGNCCSNECGECECVGMQCKCNICNENNRIEDTMVYKEHRDIENIHNVGNEKINRVNAKDNLNPYTDTGKTIIVYPHTPAAPSTPPIKKQKCLNTIGSGNNTNSKDSNKDNKNNVCNENYIRTF